MGNHQIADGMTIQIHTVDLLLETCGSACRQGGATWYVILISSLNWVASSVHLWSTITLNCYYRSL